jgi:2-C-methyl-D-erythritol 2,4-cyclodiphosphate synthase
VSGGPSAGGPGEAATGDAGGAPLVRVGHGYDVHRLVIGRPLVLGGVTLPWDLGLAGHSDGDAVCHALTDAVLGAAAAGDIGALFPSADPRWRDANSLKLLRLAVEHVARLGLGVANADVTVVLEVPRLGPYRAAMVEAVAGALGVPGDRVSIKAKTNEGLGEIGAGEAIAAHAVVLLAPA